MGVEYQTQTALPLVNCLAYEQPSEVCANCLQPEGAMADCDEDECGPLIKTSELYGQQVGSQGASEGQGGGEG